MMREAKKGYIIHTPMWMVFSLLFHYGIQEYTQKSPKLYICLFTSYLSLALSNVILEKLINKYLNIMFVKKKKRCQLSRKKFAK